jgi:hypothetical protein
MIEKEIKAKKGIGMREFRNSATQNGHREITVQPMRLRTFSRMYNSMLNIDKALNWMWTEGGEG